MTTPAEKLLEEICSKLEELGVGEYIVAFGDPDANVDLIRIAGSRFWRAGVGMTIVEDVKRRHALEQTQEEEREEEDGSETEPR